jgi:hypothetical protein
VRSPSLTSLGISSVWMAYRRSNDCPTAGVRSGRWPGLRAQTLGELAGAEGGWRSVERDGGVKLVDQVLGSAVSIRTFRCSCQ